MSVISISCQNNNKKSISIVDSKNRKIIQNEKEYDIPKKIRCHSITQIDNKIYIDGYEFKDGQFKRTIKALYHLFF